VGRYWSRALRSQCQRVIPAALLFLIFCGLICPSIPSWCDARALREVDRSRAPVALRAALVWLIPGERHHPARRQVRQVLGAAEPRSGPATCWKGGQATRFSLAETPDAAIRKRASATGSTQGDRDVTDIVSPIIYYPFIVLCL